MATLVAIGYPDETTAGAAAGQARSMARELIVEPEAIAVISRNRDGRFQVSTDHHPACEGASWGMLWGVLFGVLFFVPVLGMTVGAGLGALMGQVAKAGDDKEFSDQVRGLLQPGTSALFLMIEKVPPDQAVERLQFLGGTVLKSSLSRDQERMFHAALQAEPVAEPAT
jgi:uncharacterized membrane protein